MKPIERIAMYLKFRNINPYSFEKKINLWVFFKTA